MDKIIKLLDKKSKLEKECDKIKEFFADGRNLAVMIIFFLGGIGGMFSFERLWVKMCSLGVSLLIVSSCFFLLWLYKKKKKTIEKLEQELKRLKEELKE